ncbi:Vacuolar protein sorting-associated protein 26A-like [Heracleum sosnowskyi]|uniref:Vacuolar protein sorting-associated protein 26A-like n=1 Tax=Heracleum sosnowskyi TaxID=360622 RepID=A0AAD8JAU0_9APIA|nr:Vacuolar protein sorting-associated protein 26A-like [Heracleum sosnowskyi]
MASLCLVGPPEIKNPKPSSSLAAQESANTGNPFLDLLNSNFNSITKPLNPPTTQTENSSHTYSSTGNPCLDFFFHVVPDTPKDTLIDRLEKAYDHCPVTALKLVCNLRGVRGTGKNDKEGFYSAVLWLHKNHPKSLGCNVWTMAKFGYFKDLLEVLYRILLGSDVREVAREAHTGRKVEKQRKIKRLRRYGEDYGSGGIERPFGSKRWASGGKKKVKSKGESEVSKAASREARVLASRKRDVIEKKEAKRRRDEERIEKAKRAINRYAKDSDYRFLFERVSDFFAECLKSDLVLLESGKLRDISLAAKWCPSLDSSYDRVTLMCERIARKMFPKEEYEDGLLDAHYAYRVRDRLRKEVLVPLRKALLERQRKPAKELKAGGKAEKEKTSKKGGFLKGKVSDGWFPHEIIGGVNYGNGKLAESQWKRMVERLSRKGILKNCLAVCDVSSEMNGVPMEVAVAFAVLVSELSEEPWRRNILTLSSKPELLKVEGQDLRSKIEFVRDMKLGGNPDLQKVFDLILQSAMIGNLEKDQMIKRVFVFSDMEFYQAANQSKHWETDYQAITRKFAEKGYGLPEVVFWNLRNSRATPVIANQPGVVLVSGYSKNLMTLFLEDGGADMNPEKFMEKAIAGEEYGELVVLD